MSNHTSHQPSPRVLLRQQMAQVFIESELKTLCFDLGIDFEELGQGNKTDKIISLIRLMQRQGRLADLRAAVVDARPHLAWPTLEALESSQDEEWHGTEPTPRKLTREEQLAQRNRQSMLLKVKAYWIDGVLANSLHSKVIPLDMERKPDAVTQPRPWDMLWQHRDQQPQPLPPGTRIIDRFNYAAGDALLILGEPGSGKTTMLLELAGELLEWAEQNEALRIPVVFNLSSWATKQPPLTEWLVSELQTLYLIPRKVAQAWVEQDDILPLLDGLDEVAQEHRPACIKAINAYREAQGTPLVVCSRIADYEAIGEKLLLSDALLLRPLTPEQINDYLLAGGPALDGVRLGLQGDETLQEMAQSPLMLSIMAVAYRDQTPEQFTSTNVDERGRQLFATYLQRQLSQRKKDSTEDTSNTLRQLSYLAYQMTRRKQTIFLIEQLQPSWLSNSRQHLSYRRIYGLVLGLSLGLALGLFVGPILGLGIGLIMGLSVGLAVGLGIGLFGEIDDIELVEKVNWSWKYISSQDIVAGPVGGVSFGLYVGLRLGMANGWAVGLISGLAVGLVSSLTFGLVFGPTFGLAGGLRIGSVKLKTIPNEGIKISARNAIYFGLSIGLVAALVAGLIFGLAVGLVLGLSAGVTTGLVLGLSVGLAVWLVFGLGIGGGEAVVKHYTLRFYIHRYGYLPLKLVSFLDLATERLILQKVGGGYRFVHRLLQEYLASLYVAEGEGK